MSAYLLKETLLRRCSELAGFLFDGETGKSFILNATAAEIVSMLATNRKPDAIISSLTDRFAVPEAQARLDLELFIAKLKHLELLRDE